jgi:hypothetical protein
MLAKASGGTPLLREPLDGAGNRGSGTWLQQAQLRGAARGKRGVVKSPFFHGVEPAPGQNAPGGEHMVAARPSAASN